ncbi:MAG: family intrarane metalloprotease protein [Aeromicrobium sp.]|nr:family intrarane metalloprotease protein [Aeromicrobium sp.]
MSTRYHRLARETPAYGWWKLPVAGFLALGLFLGLTVVLLGIAFFAFWPVRGTDAFERWLDDVGSLDLTRPDFFVLDMLSLAVLIPAVLGAVWIVGPRPIGYLSSVAGRLRWGWLARNAVMSFIVFGIALVGWVLVAEAADPAEVQAPTGVDGTVVLAIVLVLLVTPLQAAAEEYVFRGYLLQLVGSWTRFATIPVLVSMPLFAAGHTYDWWGLVDVAMFGLTAAILTIRTGGLEAAIAAHTANNVVLFVLDALGVIVATDDSGAGPADLVPTALAGIVLIAWVEWSVRRHDVQTTRDPIPPPPPPAPPVWSPPTYVPIPTAPPPTYVPAAPPGAQTAPGPPPLHPRTPPYPGELPPGWDR